MNAFAAQLGGRVSHGFEAVGYPVGADVEHEGVAGHGAQLCLSVLSGDIAGEPYKVRSIRDDVDFRCRYSSAYQVVTEAPL